MATSSFDIVSKVDRQEVDNALNQTDKELRQRYDFKNTGASIVWSGELGVELRANSEERVLAVLDTFQTRLVKRGVSLKALESNDPQASGREYVITGSFQSGLTTEQAKKIAKLIRDEGPKAVKTQIQGEELRVTGKKRDDLQGTIALVKEGDWDFAVQFVNYR
jgi:uncharacterized protein YajQ (UPF0234 family)